MRRPRVATARTALAVLLSSLALGAATTATPAVGAAGQQAPPTFSWRVPASAPVGSVVTSTVRVSPARPQRQVVMQQRVNGVWQYVDRVLVRGGEAQASFVQLATGPTTYRLRTGSSRTVVRTVRGTGRAPAAPTRRLSVTANGSPVEGTSLEPSASDDGRWVAFTSYAANLLPRRDTNDDADVYLKDTVTGAVRRISRGLDGRQPRGGSLHPAISGDGRVVAFVSRAPDLVRGDRNRKADVFVWDRTTGRTTRVGTLANGAPTLSRDGRFVGFSSRVGGKPVVRLRDRRTGSLRTVSTTQAAATSPSISADGRRIVFVSGGRVVLRDLLTGRVVVVSRTSDGSPVSAADPVISDDGTTVAFDSDDPALGQRRGYPQVFRRTLGGPTELLSQRDGRPGPRPSHVAAISADGSRVLLTSESPLTADDVDDFDICEAESNCVSDHAEDDAYVVDADGTVTLASRSSSGRVSELESDAADLSPDGRRAYVTSRDALVVGQAPRDQVPYAYTDVFVCDLR